MGERALLKRFRQDAPSHPWVRIGPGDDCAILRWSEGKELAFKIDQVVEGTHFVLQGPDAASPREVGWKAMAKTCSDIAATGFSPVAATVAACMPRHLPDEWVLEVHEGIQACCEKFDFALAGGDLSTADGPAFVAVSMIGEGPKPGPKSDGAWLRSGAKPGDVLVVTGTLGGARINKRHLSFDPRLDEARRIRELVPIGIHACIDVTDGLSRDLYHICEESTCGAVLYEAEVPISIEAGLAANSSGETPLQHVLGDGEDFELLLALAPDAADVLLSAWDLDTPVRKIGSVSEPGKGILIKEPEGKCRPLPDCGWEHLSASDRRTQ